MLASLVVHLVLVIFVLLSPKLFSSDATVVPMPVPPNETVQFVNIVAPNDLPAPPKKLADASDIDRRAVAPTPVPKPENEKPASKGNTPEQVIAPPPEKAAGADTNAPPAPPPTAPPSTAAANIPAKVVPDPVPNERPAGGALGDSLRNLQRYLKNENFDNQKGQGESGVRDSDIQFDSKGVDFGPWIKRFVTQVKSNWNVPESFQKGHVVIQFYILRNGTLTDIRIIEASDVPGFNSAAINALRLSNPTLDLPKEYPLDKVLFTVTFHYNEGIK